MKNKPLAVIVFEDDGNEAVQTLWETIEQLQKKGLKVGGLLNKRDDQGGYIGEVICSISDDREYRILVDRGTGASGCRLDSVALAESSAVPREALDQGIDVLVINKFGIAEAEGGGLVAEISRAVSEGVPVLSTVHDKYAEQWRSFSGDLGIELFPMVEEVEAWLEAQLAEV
ncbi:MAG: DUF2478 domain-containing protein [Alcaligenaceae bacterium]|jgi:nucleoside-triphosphatase THEP1|nr:DUF2478 domain-containing protein [Alcaligenaceae bacterium]HZJ98119.1 DUF2478 domain-containing protein [Oligella sp.]